MVIQQSEDTKTLILEKGEKKKKCFVLEDQNLILKF